ncbi:hypothetical protein C6497_11960 [Candidatus Poribacteria bacterium]|nr:MAG: hypothetical protein C6497_11960 [Candidatus Poribacteria bacterium]
MKYIHEKSYDIVTFSIKSRTFWIRKCIDISEKKTVRYPVNPCPKIQLTDNQQPIINNYELIFAKIELTSVIIRCQNRNNTKMRKLEILLFHIFKTINTVQYWTERYNYTENKWHTM